MIPQDYYAYARSRESGGDPFAKNPRSSATGLFQFTDGTWNDMLRRHPELGLTPDGRTDPDQQTRAMAAFTNDNAGVLSSAGAPVDKNTLYLAHRFGSQGALKALSAKPDALVSDVFPEVINANPDLQGKTIAQITGQNKMADYGTEISPPQRNVPGALSAAAFLGPGSLSNDGDLGTGLERAGAYLMSISDPRALSALSSIGPKAGRFNASYDKDTGNYTIVDGQTGRVIQQRNPNFDPRWKQKEEYQKQEADSLVKLNSGIYDTAQSAQQQKAAIDQLKVLLGDPNVYQGAGGEKVQDLKKIGNALGFNVEGTSNADVARALANQLTLSMRNFAGGMPGSLSDKDLAFLKNMTISLDNKPEANAQLLDNLARVHQRAIDVNNMRQRHVDRNGMLTENFRKEVSDYAAKNPLFDNSVITVPQKPQGPQLPKGVKSIQVIQ